MVFKAGPWDFTFFSCYFLDSFVLHLRWDWISWYLLLSSWGENGGREAFKATWSESELFFC
jgi:hypothetical protein